MNALIPAWEDGRLVPLDKLEVHRRGLLHKAVSVFVLCGDDVLLQRRARTKYHTPGLWANTCCTHPHWNEAPQTCAHRRLWEELGLTGLPLEHRQQLTYRADMGNGLIEHEQVEIFLSRVETRPEPVPNPEEVCQVAWVDMAELARRTRRDPGALTPWLRIYLDRHATQIFA